MGARSVLVVTAALVLPACASRPPLPVAPLAPSFFAMPEAIVTPTEVATEAELAARGERALMEQRWQDAANAYATLVAADPTGPHAAERMFDLGLAYEGLLDRPRARDVFLE